ncbi:MAG TPA: hypothetical protein VGB24_02610 [Longimicrobium sp.]|jgi:hypothetical protein|uniref:hypothetical protein n=1 Tax=Longimicrobium sp. TaxID=2029185 RepID=UPI002EDA40FD
MHRLPARSLVDISLSEDAFRSDFEITDKYQGFSAELVRLALLGIAGYGFLLSNLALNNAQPSDFFEKLVKFRWLLGVGVVSLGVAAASALAHRFFSTDCLSHQVTILRLLKRANAEHWTPEEKAADRERLTREREEQMHDLRRCRRLLWVAAGALVLGASAVVLSFAAVLLA